MTKKADEDERELAEMRRNRAIKVAGSDCRFFLNTIWIWEVRFDIHEQAIGWQMPDALYNEKLCVPGWFRVMWSCTKDVTCEDVYKLLQRHKAAPFRPWNGFLDSLLVSSFEWILFQFEVWRGTVSCKELASFRHGATRKLNWLLEYVQAISVRSIYVTKVCLLCNPSSWHVFCHEETW